MKKTPIRARSHRDGLVSWYNQFRKLSLEVFVMRLRLFILQQQTEEDEKRMKDGKK